MSGQLVISDENVADELQTLEENSNTLTGRLLWVLNPYTIPSAANLMVSSMKEFKLENAGVEHWLFDFSLKEQGGIFLRDDTYEGKT